MCRLEWSVSLTEPEKIASELESLYRRVLVPFPYDDCRVVMRGCGMRDPGFIPDLDLFFSTIAGYSCGARRLGRRPKEELEHARCALSRSFYQRHPEHSHFQPLITPERTPELYAQMQVFETMRQKLLLLLKLLRSAPPA